MVGGTRDLNFPPSRKTEIAQSEGTFDIDAFVYELGTRTFNGR